MLTETKIAAAIEGILPARDNPAEIRRRRAQRQRNWLRDCHVPALDLRGASISAILLAASEYGWCDAGSLGKDLLRNDDGMARIDQILAADNDAAIFIRYRTVRLIDTVTQTLSIGFQDGAAHEANPASVNYPVARGIDTAPILYEAKLRVDPIVRAIRAAF